MRFSVCIDSLFREAPAAQAMGRIKELGLDAVEFWSWEDKDLEGIALAKEELGMDVAGFCTSCFALNDPAKQGVYLDCLKKSVEVASRLKTKKLITQAGQDIEGASREFQRQAIVECLGKCAGILEDAGIELLVEPLNNKRDHAGTFLWSSDEGFSILEEVSSPNVKLLYDFYHMQIMEGNLLERSLSHLPLIGHFHCAGVPGRHELDLGETSYPYLFKSLDEAGYGGYFGLEYFPVKSVDEGLRALASFDKL
jgi:hydroxypyruvate isomerase